MKVYGPYLRKDGRKHVIIIYSDGSRQTQSYPRYLMEKRLGRKLNDSEHIDHINEDHTDNRIENLQILTQHENNTKCSWVGAMKSKIYKFICPICKKEARKLLTQVKHNRDKGKAGPFCSRTCAGKYSHTITKP